MYGFENTKCKIETCSDLVWPNKTLGYCHKHYQRYRTGRMDENGDLLQLPQRTKMCKVCGTDIVLGPREHRTKWCKECRPKEYARIQTENNHGIYGRGQRIDTQKRDRGILSWYLDCIIRDLDKIQHQRNKYRPIIMAREAGKTFREIGIEFHFTHQRAQQICAKYL